MQYPSIGSKTSKVMECLAHCTAFEQIDGFQLSLSLLNLTLYNGGNHVDKIRKFRILEQDTIQEWKACYAVESSFRQNVGQKPY